MPGNHTITLQENSIPVKMPCSRIPLSLRENVKNKLDDLEKLKVIEKVTYPTDWINQLVIVEKPDHTLRLCLNPKELNKVIKKET